MHVTHVIPALRPGGIWRHLEIMEELHKESHLVSTVVTLFAANDRDLVGKLSIKIITLDFPLKNLKSEVIVGAELKSAIDILKPDIVHSYHFYSDIHAIPVGAELGIPSIRAVHGITQAGWEEPFDREKVYLEWPNELIQRELALESRCAKTVVVSNQLQRLLIKYGIPASKISRVYPCVSAFRISKLQGRKANRDLLTVAFIGRLEPVKNPLAFLRVARICIERSLPLQFLIVGDGILSAEVDAAVRNLGITDHITRLPFTLEPEPIFAEADIVVLTSYSEGLPFTALEGMAAGSIVVASRVGGLEEAIVDGTSGFLCSVDDYRGYADVLEALAADGSLRAEISHSARQTVEKKFTKDQHKTGYLRVYGDVINGEL